jgi:hypothetical protein
MALATTQKGSSSAAEYVAKMKTLADEMASAGKKLDDEELISYILAGLDYEYNSLVSSIAARVEPVTLDDMYSQLLAFETRLELQNGAQTHAAGLSVPPPHASVNSASRGRGGFSRGRGGRNSRGSFGAGGRGRGDPSKPRNKFPPCQLCGKTNHPVFKCFKRFDPSYMGDERSPNAVTSYGVDYNWYADSGATDHVTEELDKLAVRDAYNGPDQIFTASGSCMCIKHIGQSIIHTPYRDLQLNHILHVPQSSKNLASVHHLTSDNNVFFELYPDFFLIKDRESRKTLLQCKSRGGLYPLPCSPPAASAKQVLNVSKIPTSR